MTASATRTTRPLDPLDRIAACIDPEAFSAEVDALFQACQGKGPSAAVLSWMPRITEARRKATAVLLELEEMDEPVPVPIAPEILSRYDGMLAPLGFRAECAPEPGTGFGHLRWMLSEIGRVMPTRKADRWLGFVQGIIIDRGFTTVTAERDFTRPFFNRKR
mgnify:CR=1 FL=1